MTAAERAQRRGAVSFLDVLWYFWQGAREAR